MGMDVFRLKKGKMKEKMSVISKFTKGGCIEERINCFSMCSGHGGSMNGLKERPRLIVRKVS